MKIILVPTDFSKNADNALTYAIEIAKKEKAKLLLAHAYHIDYLSSTFPAKFIEEEIEHAALRANYHLRVKCEFVTKTNKVKCDYVSQLGLATDVILNLIKQKKPDLVIMGTHGASGLKAVFMGSNTASVIGKAKCPVIAVPASARYKEFRKIVYTTDFHDSDILSLSRLIKLVSPFNRHIEVIHIYDGEFIDRQKASMKKFEEKAKKKITYKNISFRVVQAANEEDELKRISKSKSNDLLVMSTHHRYLLDKLLNKSMTKKIAFQASIPLMVFHHKEEPLIVI